MSPMLRLLILILILICQEALAVEVGFSGEGNNGNVVGLVDYYSLSDGILLFEENSIKFNGCPYAPLLTPVLTSDRVVQGQGDASLQQTIYEASPVRTSSVTSILEVKDGEINLESNGASNPYGSSISQTVSSSQGELKAGLREDRDGAYVEVMAYKKNGFMSVNQRLDSACALMATQQVTMDGVEVGYAYAKAMDCHGNTAGVNSWVNDGDLYTDQLAMADCGWPCQRVEPLVSDLAVATQTSMISGEYGGGDAYGTNGFGDAKTLIAFTKGDIDLDSAVSSTDDYLQFANDLSGQADHMTQSVVANNQLDSVHLTMGFIVKGKFLTDIDINMMR